jgi:hypothetical protein
MLFWLGEPLGHGAVDEEEEDDDIDIVESDYQSIDINP